MGRPEDSRVKIPALVHFTRLGYTYMSIKDKERNVDYDGDTNIFYSQFLSAINRINHKNFILADAKKIIGELKIKLGNDDLGKSFFQILQSGIDGIKLIDFDDVGGANNDYTVVTELPYENGDDSFRPDIVVLINGIPLSFIEVKRHNNREGILTERNRMEKRFGNKIYRRFVGITQFMVFSNNNEYDDSDIEPIQGAFYASSSYRRMFFSKFREPESGKIKLRAKMKAIVPKNEAFILSDTNLISIKGTPEYISSLSEDSPTNRIITSLYTKERLLFLLKYGMRDNCDNQRDLALIDILASTGMRVGELVLLNRDDISFDERECIVFGKGDKERMVYFDARTKLHLQNYLESRTDNEQALFVSLKAPYRRMKIGGIELRLREMGKRLNIDKVHPHKFRRTLATVAIDKGMPIEQLQKLLGHQRIDTTLQYAMVKQSNVKIAHRKYIG